MLVQLSTTPPSLKTIPDFCLQKFVSSGDSSKDCNRISVEFLVQVGGICTVFAQINHPNIEPPNKAVSTPIEARLVI